MDLLAKEEEYKYVWINYLNVHWFIYAALYLAYINWLHNRCYKEFRIDDQMALCWISTNCLQFQYFSDVSMQS